MATAGIYTFIPAGALAGGLIDWFITKKPKPPASRSWQLAPAVGLTSAKGKRRAVVMLRGTIDLGRIAR